MYRIVSGNNNNSAADAGTQPGCEKRGAVISVRHPGSPGNRAEFSKSEFRCKKESKLAWSVKTLQAGYGLAVPYCVDRREFAASAQMTRWLERNVTKAPLSRKKQLYRCRRLTSTG